VSRDPVTKAELRTRFEGDRPVPGDAVAFWPSEDFRDSCQSAAGEYCLTLNLFAGESTARAWAERAGVPGEVLSVAEATERSAARWVANLRGDEATRTALGVDAAAVAGSR
jgi:hypothetical protein